MTNYLKKSSLKSLNNDMSLSEYSFKELGFIQKSRAIFAINDLVINILDLKNQSLWSEHWITRDLIECIISKLDTTFNDMGSIKRVSKKLRKYSDKIILRIYDQCKKIHYSKKQVKQ